MGQVLAEGDAAPHFVLLGIEGTPVQFKDFARRKLVLYFYPKDDTSGCTKQAINFNAMRAEFAAAGTDILGVSPDSMASHTTSRCRLPPMRPSILSTPMACGRRRACMAASIWASSAPPS
jgi:peroxiredoxin Q/BCP